MGSYESRPKSIFETLGALAASALIAGGASAQEQRPRGRPITQAQYEETLPPAERAAQEAYRRRAQTDPELIRIQREADARDRAFQAECAKLRSRVAKGDRSELGTAFSSACRID